MTFNADDSFVDKKGRENEFDIDDDIVAHIDGKKIGHAEHMEIDDHPWLAHISVDEEYRRAGIGRELIKHFSNQHGRNFGKPSFSADPTVDRESHQRYTDEGAALIEKCIAEGIIDDTDSPTHDGDHDE